MVKVTGKTEESRSEYLFKYLILVTFALVFIIFGFFVNSPKDIYMGLQRIILSRDVLITDYVKIGGIGAAFVNSGLLTLIFILLLYLLKINPNGVAIAALFSISGFSLFGKNLLNVWSIVLGVFIYSKIQKEQFNKYIYIALFGTAMSPIATEFIFTFDLPYYLSIPLGILIGTFVGFILPPISSHLLKIHQGYNLYNIGFTAGIITTIVVALFKSYGYQPETRLEYSVGNNQLFSIFLYLIFLSFIILGIKEIKNYTRVLSYSGRLVTDFVSLEGIKITLLNMGINGIIATSYVLLINGELNGPTIGGILTIVGFSAFGKHPKNILPIFLGIYLGSLTKIWLINDPSIILAALFGTSLAPIAGEFGIIMGIIAGFLHSSVVLNVVNLHGGLNLYNNGFSAGIVAAVMVPIIEAFRKEDYK